jgi:hypothetical protein
MSHIKPTISLSALLLHATWASPGHKISAFDCSEIPSIRTLSAGIISVLELPQLCVQAYCCACNLKTLPRLDVIRCTASGMSHLTTISSFAGASSDRGAPETFIRPYCLTVMPSGRRPRIKGTMRGARNWRARTRRALRKSKICNCGKMSARKSSRRNDQND